VIVLRVRGRRWRNQYKEDKKGGWRGGHCEEEHDEAISFVRLPRRKAPRNGEVGMIFEATFD